MLPLHEAAVPLCEAEAMLTTAMRADSVLANPTAGNRNVRVKVGSVGGVVFGVFDPPEFVDPEVPDPVLPPCPGRMIPAEA